VAPEWVFRSPRWYQSGELLPDGLDEVRLEREYGDTPLRWEASATPRMIEHPVPALQVDTRIPIGGSAIRSLCSSISLPLHRRELQR